MSSGGWVDRMRHRMSRRRREGDEQAEVVSETADEDLGGGGETDIPTVPYVPVLCPRCGHGEKVTDGVHHLKEGRTRYHICKQCRQQFRSIEVLPRTR